MVFCICTQANPQQTNCVVSSLMLLPSGLTHPHLRHQDQLHSDDWLRNRASLPMCYCRDTRPALQSITSSEGRASYA